MEISLPKYENKIWLVDFMSPGDNAVNVFVKAKGKENEVYGLVGFFVYLPIDYPPEKVADLIIEKVREKLDEHVKEHKRTEAENIKLMAQRKRVVDKTSYLAKQLGIPLRGEK